ncbi:MAG: pitrilysin family protein, partial [Myxococcota bacterium]|nr:pitrilysin family protein [Myxococcota bacterium]
MSKLGLLATAPIFVLSGLLAGCATVPKQQKTEPMFDHVSTTPYIGDLVVDRYVLRSNQLSVLLVRDPQSDTIAFHTYFDVGSSDEVEGKTGLAHLFEHMMFKRTGSYGDQHFSKTLEEAGAPDLNAWTWLDITAYHVSLPKAQLPLIIDLEATRMDGLIIDKGQLDAEREVVLNERRYRVDNNPEGAMSEQLWALAFESNRYHWPTIGWEDDIKGYSVEDCTDFYRSYYAPNNATVVLAGGFEVQEALDLIAQSYGDIPASDLARLEHGPEAAQTELRRKDMDLEMESEVLLWAFKVPAIDHADRPALAVLDAILTAGDSSRMQRRFIDSGWASSAEGWLPPFQHEALYEFLVTLREGKSAEAAIAILRQELADLQTRPVSAEELNRARAQLLAGQYGQLLSNSGRAGFLGFYEVAWGDWQNGLKFLDQLRAVTAEDVQRVARTWFSEDRSSMVVGRPKTGAAPAFAEENLPKIAAPSGTESPAVAARSGVGGPDLAGAVVHEEAMDGWTRLLAHDPALPMVWFQVVLPVGSGSENPARAGLANLTAELLLRGTTERDRETFAETLEGFGATVAAEVGADSTTIGGSCLSEHWPKVAALLAEAFAKPAFTEEDFALLVDEIKADIIQERNDDRSLAGRFYARGLFGGHPYGRPVLGTLESLDAIERDEVRAFYEKHFGSQGAIVGLLGDFDAQAPADLEGLIAALPEGSPPAAGAALPSPPQGRKIVLVDKPERTQVQIYLGHFFARPEGAGYAAAWTANEAFAGYGFGARLMQEVREKRGWSYGAYGSIRHRRDLSSYSLWVFPATADAIPCLQLVLDLYESLRDEGLSEEELTYARSSIVNSAAFYGDTPSKRLAYAIRKRQTGYDPLPMVPLVADLSLEEVNAAAASAFDPDNLFAVMVGTADAKVSLGEGEEARELTLR